MGIENKDSPPTVIRSNVPPKNSYSDYREDMRRDFYYSCAYCTIMETEAAGLEFAIDHYKPKSKFPSEEKDYNNLMWSCKHCNSYKGNFFPSPLQEKKDHRIIRPDEEDPRDHYHLLNDRLESETSKGDFTIHRLNLNRITLRRLRKIRREIWESHDFIIRGISQIMRISIDAFPSDKRARLIGIKNHFLKNLELMNLNAQELIEQAARSHFVDQETMIDTEENKVRKKFLKESNALVDYNLSIPDAKKNVKSNKRKKRSSGHKRR